MVDFGVSDFWFVHCLAGEIVLCAIICTKEITGGGRMKGKVRAILDGLSFVGRNPSRFRA